VSGSWQAASGKRQAASEFIQVAIHINVAPMSDRVYWAASMLRITRGSPMDRVIFVAETEVDDTVSHIWIQKGALRPRPVQPNDVKQTALEESEFFGASKDLMLAWLKQLSSTC